MGLCFSKEKDNMPVVGYWVFCFYCVGQIADILLWYDILVMISIVPIADFTDAKANASYDIGHSIYTK